MAIDLTCWNLTTPEADPSDPGLARTYSTADLATLDNAYFHPLGDAEGSIRFWAPVAGEVTANTDRTRTELRETNPDGTQRNWTIGTYAVLRAAFTMRQLPSNGITVVGQIHAKNTTSPLVKLKWKPAGIYASVRKTPADANPVDTLVSTAALNQRTTYVIQMTATGLLKVFVNSAPAFTAQTTGWDAALLYFKAGVYNQDSTADTPTEASMADFHRIEVTH